MSKIVVTELSGTFEVYVEVAEGPFLYGKHYTNFWAGGTSNTDEVAQAIVKAHKDTGLPLPRLGYDWLENKVQKLLHPPKTDSTRAAHPGGLRQPAG